MNNNKKTIILLVFIIALLSFTTFFSFSRYSSQKIITNVIRTKELKIFFETNGNTTAAKSHGSVVNIIDTHSDNITDSRYVWSLNSNTTAATGTSFTSGDEISTDGLSGTYYLCVYALDDKGFYNNTCSNAFYFDNTAPTIKVTLDSDNTVYKKSHNAIIEVTNDAYGADLDLDSFKYVWTKNIYVEPNLPFANGDTVTKSDGTGSYYVMVTACDTLGNCNDYQSNASKLDNTVPLADIRVEVINGERFAVLDTYDEHSGVADVESADGITAETKEKNLKIYVSTFNGLGSWGATDYNDYATMLAEAGYTDVTVVDPANGLPTLEYLQNNGYNTLIFNRAVWSTDQALMNQVFAAGINLFTSGDDSDSGLDIIQDSTTISPIDSYGDIEGNDTLFTNRVGQINGNSDVGTYVHFISGAETFYTRVVNGTTYGVGGCYTNNGTRWFHFQEAIGLFNNNDSKLIKAAVDYMANKGLVYFKIPSDNTYTFDITDNAGNVLQITHAIQGYTVEYYQGNNTSSESAAMLPYTSQFDNDVEYNLLTYSALGGVAPSGWTFAGWTTEKNSTNIVYQDGQSVTNLASGGNTVKLYAVFMRTVTIYSGYNKATSSTAIQYYNPCKNTYYTKINVPAPSTTGLSGWSARGYRSDTTAADKTYTVTTSAANIGIDPNAGNTIYAVYSRTITMYHGKNKATTSTATQYYNTNNSVSSISAPAPSTTNLSGWNARGYREDTSTSDRTYAVTTSAANIKPAYNSSNTLYAVYSRTVTFAYNGNGSTSGSTASQTGTQYYNTNNDVSTVTVKSQSNGFTRTGYIFNKWAYDSASGTQVAAGSNISFAPTVDKTGNNLTRTMFATWTAKTVTVKYYRNSSSSDTSTVSQTFTYDVANQKFGYENGSPKWGTSGQFGSWDRVGYKLLGWSTNRSATSATYSPYNGVSNSWINSSYDNNSNHTVTLYGIWQSVAITVIQDGVLKQSGIINISSSSARRQDSTNQGGSCTIQNLTALESIRPSDYDYPKGTKRYYGTNASGSYGYGYSSSCYPYLDITITFNSAYNGRTATFELYAFHTARFHRGDAQFYVNGTLKKQTGENGWDTYFTDASNATMEASYSSSVTINGSASLRIRVAAKTGDNDMWAPIAWGGIRSLTVSA